MTIGLSHAGLTAAGYSTHLRIIIMLWEFGWPWVELPDIEKKEVRGECLKIDAKLRQKDFLAEWKSIECSWRYWQNKVLTNSKVIAEMLMFVTTKLLWTLQLCSNF